MPVMDDANSFARVAQSEITARLQEVGAMQPIRVSYRPFHWSDSSRRSTTLYVVESTQASVRDAVRAVLGNGPRVLKEAPYPQGIPLQLALNPDLVVAERKYQPGGILPGDKATDCSASFQWDSRAEKLASWLPRVKQYLECGGVPATTATATRRLITKTGEREVILGFRSAEEAQRGVNLLLAQGVYGHHRTMEELRDLVRRARPLPQRTTGGGGQQGGPTPRASALHQQQQQGGRPHQQPQRHQRQPGPPRHQQQHTEVVSLAAGGGVWGVGGSDPHTAGRGGAVVSRPQPWEAKLAELEAKMAADLKKSNEAMKEAIKVAQAGAEKARLEDAAETNCRLGVIADDLTTAAAERRTLKAGMDGIYTHLDSVLKKNNQELIAMMWAAKPDVQAGAPLGGTHRPHQEAAKSVFASGWSTGAMG